MNWLRIASAGLVLLTASSVFAGESAQINVDLNKTAATVSPTLYGIFFEEINRSGDGGIYSELIQNRSFEDADKPVAWDITPAGAASIDPTVTLNEKNRHSLKLQLSQDKPIHLRNEGYYGIPVKQGQSYNLSLWVRGSGSLAAAIESTTGKQIAIAKLGDATESWQQLKTTLTVNDTDPAAKLLLTAQGNGTMNIDVVSLMPTQSWKNHPFRADLGDFLANMHPAFMRFPGGCWVEGETNATSYRWKRTIGAVEDRWNQYNIWKYYSTNGLGYHEYLQLCEDIGAVPLFVVNCGMSHVEQRKSDRHEKVPMDDVPQWVQDALDAIEYANGPADSKWGAIRAKNGHPSPFNLKFMEIGNENGGPVYNERYALFYDAIKKNYPEIRLVADLWRGNRPTNRPVELLDEHYYSDPGFFIRNANRYDKYDRNGPKIYVGEYAVTHGCGTGNLRAAVAEAAFMTGMERNSDVVQLASYAPLFANVHYKGWNPNAINFDASRSYGTPSYWVQNMFSRNRADVNYVTTVQSAAASDLHHEGAIGVGTWKTQAEFKDIVVEKDGKTIWKSDFSHGLGDWTAFKGDWWIRGGNLRQTSEDEACYATFGDPSWTDYTISLKARKFTGSEGFLIRFHSTGRDSFTMWNIGGWGNTKHAVEYLVDGASSRVSNDVPGQIENQRWYDIRIETKGDNVKCYLDGKLVHDLTYGGQKSLFAIAGKKGKDVVMKIVNVSKDPQEADVTLNGLSSESRTATTEMLTSADANDENSLENPNKVVPTTASETIRDAKMHHVFPGNSVTIVRVAAQ